METSQSTALVIKEHDFQEAKNSLKKYTEQAKKDIELSTVPRKEGLFNLGTHKVTGEEFNDRLSQIQSYFISLNNLNQGLVDELGQVYKAFEFLDRDYISGIVTSIKAAEEVSKKEQKDRKDIKELVEQHKQSIAVLKKFKADIEKFKHLTDIDKAWELIEQQAKLSKKLSNYKTELSKLKHLNDVDTIYIGLEEIKKDFAKVSELQIKYTAELKVVREYCDSLSAIEHIKDIDRIWENSEALADDIKLITESLDVQKKAVSDFEKILQRAQEVQQQFIEKVNSSIADFCDVFDGRVKTLADNQTTKLNDIKNTHKKAIEQLLVEQRESLSSIKSNQKETLDSALKEQSFTLSNIERSQEEALEQLSKSQSEALDQISKEQSANWEQAIKLLEEEKNALNKQVTVIAQKAKLAYIVAGGAATLTIVQLILNVLGII